MSKSNPYAAKKTTKADSTPEPVVEEPQLEVPSGSITVILKWVDGDAEKAKAALAEEIKSDKPRVSLIAQLEELI